MTPDAEHIQGLLPHHVRHLAASGLTSVTIQAAGIYSETAPDKVARLLNWRKPTKGLAPAIMIPFKGLDGSNGYYRVRPDTPRIVKGKPVKYESPRGERNRVYFPPGVAEVCADPAAELLITEGEKKALAATQFGFPCIGLVGVLGWKEKGREQPLLELEQVAWQGRQVRIVFDSDLDVKPQVAEAECRLAKVGTDRGAIVRCVRLPDGAPDAEGKPTKVGLDDFLVAHGAGELRKLLDSAVEPEPPDAADTKNHAQTIEPATAARDYLAALESDGICRLMFHRGDFRLSERGRYIDLDTAEVQTDLVRTLNRDFAYLTTGIIANCMAQVKAQASQPSRIEPPAWLGEPRVSWPATEVLATHRELVHLPSLVSGKSPFSIPSTPRFFNQVALTYDFDVNAPRPALWLDFLSQLWPSDSESVDTLQEWCGYLLTTDTSLQKIIMLIGPPRSGKGTICRVVTELIGKHNVAGPTLASFEQNFGLQSLLGKSLAVVNDARLTGRADQSRIVERLLSISGEDSLDIDRKHRDPVTAKIPARLMIVSNELPRLAESSGALASRLIILRLNETFLGREDRSLSAKLQAELPGILLWAVAGWQRLNQRGYFKQPRSGDELAADMKDLSSPIGQFLRERCEVGPQFEVARADIYAAWKEWCESVGRDHPGAANTFGRDLRAAIPGLRDANRRAGDGRNRFYEGVRLLD